MGVVDDVAAPGGVSVVGEVGRGGVGGVVVACVKGCGGEV